MPKENNEVSSEQLQELVRCNLFFEGASISNNYEDSFVNEFIESIEIKKFLAGDIVFRQGDEGDSIVLVVKGKTTIIVNEGTEEEIYIADVEENNFFGEMAIIDDDIRMATIKAATDSYLGILPSDVFWHHFPNSPLLAKNILRVLSRRLRQMDDGVRDHLEKQALLEKKEKVMLQGKFSNLEQLAVGLAHEVNQPLTYINTILQSTIDKLERGKIDKDKLITKFNKASAQVNRIIQLTNHLRALRWPSDTESEDIDISAVIEDAIIIKKEELESNNIALQLDIPENLPSLLGHFYKLEQIFINLIENSITALAKQSSSEISITITSEGNNVCIRFSDNGFGMDSEVQSKIFEPFFTTKGHGKGAGIGMGIILEIVLEHHGQITCDSEPGQGTTFIITLPVKNEALS